MAGEDWKNYYEAVRNEPPHRTLLDALGLMETGRLIPREKFAIDLGCGAGRDTLELLHRGWKVLAVDSQPQAIEHLLATCPPGVRASLQTLESPFETLALPECDLLNASLSLPFVRPERFEPVWEKCVSAIRPGGWFAGHFFGLRDEWAPRADITTHSDEDVRALFSRFQIKSFSEKEEDGFTVLKRPKHWHRFSVVARKVL